MLSGRYPSDEFAELRPRVTWDRVNGTGRARGRAPSRWPSPTPARFPIADSTACSCSAPSATARASASSTKRWCSRRAPARRFCSAPRRGASSRSRTTACIVSPAPGAARQDAVLEGRSGRPSDRARLCHRQAGARAAPSAPGRRRRQRLEREHGLDALAAANLLQYLDDQQRAVDAVPDDRTLLIERTSDDLGDWRVLVLSSLGSRVHAPWAMAVTRAHSRRAGRRRRDDVGRRWVRRAAARRRDAPPDPALMLPDPDEVEAPDSAPARIDGALRRALPRSGGPRAAAAAPAARRARAAVAAAQARRGSAVGRGALRIVSDHPRDLSRGPARRLRSAGAGRRAAADPQPLDARRDDRIAHAVAVCRVAAVQLRRQLHLRRRRAARRAPRAGAVGRSVAAARADRRSRAARSARHRAPSKRVEAELQHLPRALSRAIDRRRARPAAAHRRSHARRDRAHVRCPAWPDAAVPALLDGAPGHRAADRRRAAARRRRGRGALSRCARHAAARRACRRRCSSRSPIALGDLVKRYARTHGPFTRRRRRRCAIGLPLGADRSRARRA